MHRLPQNPRPNWRQAVESLGFAFHTADEPEGAAYWDESAAYALASGEVDIIESATEELRLRCLDAVQHVIDHNLLHTFAIPEPFHPWIIDSWNRDDPTLYGRFDLAYDGAGSPKLLEYNADTPTSLLEAAVIQWQWREETHPRNDQFNSIHDKLIAAWAWLRQHAHPIVHFTAADDSLEDYITLQYLRDTAQQGGLKTYDLPISQLGFNSATTQFVGARNEPVKLCFKLYPWEWLTADAFAPHLLTAPTRWIEPPWKMLLSNKALLPTLWELFPSHPNLLEASFSPLAGGGHEVRKPLLSREGANIAILVDGTPITQTAGDYGPPYIYQRHTPLFADPATGLSAVLGSWIIGDEPAGLGIRESTSPITTNLSRFVPHYIT